MARYQYAKNEHGEIVKAVDLVGQEEKSEYICLGCDNPRTYALTDSKKY